MPKKYYLTPVECERIMGWTQYGMDHQLISDSARYKALGNSIVVPCAEYILANVAKVYSIQKLYKYKEV